MCPWDVRKSFFRGLGLIIFSRYLYYYTFSLRILIFRARQFGTGQRLWTRMEGLRKTLNKKTFFRKLLNKKPFASNLLIDNFPSSKWSNFEATWSRFSCDAFYHTKHCAICTVCHFLRISLTESKTTTTMTTIIEIITPDQMLQIGLMLADRF